jgi:hypothetical protein
MHMWLLKSLHACWNLSNDTSLGTVAIILWERLRSFFYLRFDAVMLAVVSAPYLCTNPFLKRIWLFTLPLSVSGWVVFMVLNIKTAIYWDVTSCILVDIYMHFVGTCCIFTPIVKMNILQEYIASIVSSVQTIKLVDGCKHSQGSTVCTFSSTYRLESRICCDVLEEQFVTIFSSSWWDTYHSSEILCGHMTILLWPWEVITCKFVHFIGSAVIICPSPHVQASLYFFWHNFIIGQYIFLRPCLNM